MDRQKCQHALKRNNTSYPVRISARLRELFAEYQRLAKGSETSERALAARGLKYYQFMVRELLANPEYGVGACGNSRGLLIYHTMGMGKTYLAVACAMALWDVRQPIVLAPKSLHQNFRKTVEQFVALMNPGMPADGLAAAQAGALKRFRYVSLDAYNMARQMARATSGVEGSGSVNNRLLIVDEAHNLFRAIINSPTDKTNARKLYEMVMDAENVKILFLTGTVPSKDPFELVPCFNMLVGYDLLPTQYEVFYKYYVSRDGSEILNRGKLENRLVGLVSHVTHRLPSGPGAKNTKNALRAKGGFPEELETKIERIQMSPDQYGRYLQAREKEEAEGKGGGLGPSAERISNSPALSLPAALRGGGSTYYVRSRSLSNFAPPREYRDMSVQKMPDKAFTAETSPKAARLVQNLAKSPGPALVYSQFVDVGGLAVIGRFLQKAGYTRYWPSTGPGEKGDGKRYAVIAGGVHPEDRARIQQVFNSPENIRGKVIKVLLVSKTGAEGLDLKNLRQNHIFEPYWDKSREKQVKARGTRLGSHDALPPEDRDVQPFLYIAVANEKMFAGMQPTAQEEKAPPRRYALVENITIDERFHQRALTRDALNLKFRRLLLEVCLECSVNGYAGCRLCVPTGATLFHADPARDLQLSDSCQPLEETEVRVAEISLEEGGGKTATYYYRREPGAPLGVRFYEFDPDLEAYAPVDPSSDLFLRLHKKLGGQKPLPQGAM